jgi:hypothetical protein
LLAPEGPLLLELHDLGSAIEDNGGLRSPQTTGTDHRVIFQELMAKPFPRLGVTCSESSNHSYERNLYSCGLTDVTL